MSIMQQSSKAQDRDLGVWFFNIKQGNIKLPRFQRYEAWDKNRITSFLNTIINNLPVGITLSLEVAPGYEKFLSRYIKTAEPDDPEVNIVNQHLLDGQQRLTSFWRSMHNNYPKETYFIYAPEMDFKKTVEEINFEVFCQSRWHKQDGSRMPRWTDDPKQCLDRKLIPIHLLQPGDNVAAIEKWIKGASLHLKPIQSDPDAFQKLENYNKIKENIKDIIIALRERISRFNLPYLSLPSNTPKDVALQVFINMNTNSKPLSLYDIIVAEVENIAGKSLHDLEDELVFRCPKADRFGDIRNIILATSALLQDKLPNNRGMIEMNKQQLLDNWFKLETGLERMANLLESQAVFDAARLPTNAVLAVIAALYDCVPLDGDYRAKAEKLLRSYMWTSFFTDRYDNSAASRAYADFKGLKQLLENPQFLESDKSNIPIFDKSEYSLVSVDEMVSEGWPKKVGIIPRGILAAVNTFGGEDFADGQIVNYESVQKREYHHLFPDALLKCIEDESFIALNCALITWKTNRVIGRKDPLDYLKDRVELASEDDIKQRLKTHLIPWNELVIASYEDYDSEETKNKIKSDFNKFLKARATLLDIAIQKLAKGEKVTLDYVWSEYERNN